jgi:quinol monooxygenase YgiN
MSILSEPIDPEDEDINNYHENKGDETEGEGTDGDNDNESGGTDTCSVVLGPSSGTVTEDEEDEEALNFTQQHHDRTMSQVPTVALPIFLMSFMIVDMTKQSSQQSLFDIMNATSEKARRDECTFNHFCLQRFHFPDEASSMSDYIEGHRMSREGDTDFKTPKDKYGQGESTKNRRSHSVQGVNTESEDNESVKIAQPRASGVLTNSPAEYATSVGDKENENAASVMAIPHNSNFMVHAGFDSSELLERHVNRKYAGDALSTLLSEHIVLSLPIVTTWHRCNFEECNYDHRSFKPAGTFFVRRTRYLGDLSPRMQILERLCEVAHLMVAEAYAGKAVGLHEQDINNNTRQEAQDGCVSYDVLFSDKFHHRFDEIVEWSSWTSKEAYLREQEKADNNPTVQRCFEFVDPFSYRRNEVTFWQTHPKMP